MNEKELRDALLKQNGGAHPGPLEAELTALQRLIDAEQHRARRLTIWAIVVWSVWLLMITTALVLPMVDKVRNGRMPAAIQRAEQRSVQPPAPGSPRSGNNHVSIFGFVLGGFLFALMLGLPIAGVVLLVMMILGRRTASTNQLRASVAALDAKLRLLELQKSSEGG